MENATLSDLFEYIKSNVDIVQFAKNEPGFKVTKVGDSTYRVEPCFCGHDGCLTLNEKDKYAKCFSCGFGGDVINLERRLKGYKTNLEAAQSIAKKMNLSLNDPTSKKAHQNETSSKSKTDNQKELFIPRTALEAYQPIPEKVKKWIIDKRGWSLEIIEKFEIGYNPKNKRITIPIYDKDSKLRNIRQYKPKVKNNKFISYGRGYGKGRLFPLSVLEDIQHEEGIIYLTEGESDCLCGLSHGLNCITQTTGARTWRKSWNVYFKGLKVVIIYDNDEPGKEGSSNVAKNLVNVAKTVEILQWPASMKKGEDLTDWFIKYGKTVEELLALSLETISKKQEDSSSHFYHFESFEVIGEDTEGRIVFWSKVNRKLYNHSLKELQLDQLIQLGGEEVRKRITNGRTEQEGKILFRPLKRYLIVQASKRQLRKRGGIGQGISFLKNGNLFFLNGEAGYIWDGKEFIKYDEPLLDGKLINRDAEESWINFESLEKQVLSMTSSRAMEIQAEAFQLIKQWHFTSNTFDISLVTGFLFAQMVQAVWSWRPHMWLTASAGSGKTMMIEFFETIAGSMFRRLEGQTLTEAGLRQDLREDFRMYAIDEFEKSKERDDILALARSASRGGHTVKGTHTQKRTIDFNIRHMLLFASIELRLDKAAEKSRFIVVELQKEIDIDPPKIPNIEEAKRLHLDFFSLAIWQSLRARRLIKKLGRLQGLETRFVECFAVPLSMLTVENNEDNAVKTLREVVINTIKDREKQARDVIVEDEERLLQDIGSAKINVPTTERDEISDKERNVYLSMAISQILKEVYDTHSESKDALLQSHGIKICPDGIFLNPDVIERYLLKDTDWVGMKIFGLLKRIRGAEYKRRRIAGKNPRGFLLPKEAVEALVEDLN